MIVHIQQRRAVLMGGLILVRLNRLRIRNVQKKNKNNKSKEFIVVFQLDVSFL